MKKKGLLLAVFACVLCFGCQKADETKDTDSKKQAEEEQGVREDGYSPIIADKEIDEDNEYPYEIRVNRMLNCITVYGADDTGKYTIPVRAMICSTGNETPSGTFQLGDSSRWKMETEGDFVQYATSIVDDVTFCSAPYDSQNNQTLDVEQFNKMGQVVSGSSVQLEVADARWIAKNCPSGTKVEIYESKDEGPLGKPKARVLEADAKKDPTDTSKNTNKDEDYVPVVFSGVEDKVVLLAQSCNWFEGVSAQDNDRQDLTAKIRVFGNVDVMTPGTYEIVYTCQNEENESRAVACNVQVQENTAALSAPQEVQPSEEVSQPTSGDNKNSATVGGVTKTEPSSEPTVFRNPVIEVENTATPQPTATPVPQPVSTPVPVSAAYKDTQAPVITLIADTRYVKDVSQGTLESRIQVMDDSGNIAGVYITVQPLNQNSMYVVIYEAEDAEGNKSCISETVQIPPQVIFR